MTTTASMLLGLGLATPTHDSSQSQTTALALSATLEDPSLSGLVAGLYTRAGVDRRASVLLRSATVEGEPLDQDFFPLKDNGQWPTTADRMRAFEAAAGLLVLRAARSALTRSGVSPDQITDLVTVSCTGLGSPGIDISIMTGLLLSAGVRRVNIGFMGCHGAIVALRTAAALAIAPSGTADVRPRKVLVVCIELCSLHLQRTSRLDRHVSNALFADGCAAMVVGTPLATPPATHLSVDSAPPMHIVDASSKLFQDSTAAMAWHIGDHGFEMTLDRSVPALLQRHLGDWLWPWLRSRLGSAAQPNDLRWAIHPGGPRVLDAVAGSLGLTQDHTLESRAVLREHGNMSSPTVLFIIDRLRTHRDDARPIVALAFGPGLTGEAALLATAPYNHP